ncbi:putative nucleotidyltransferase [Actinoplanes octamycinicus]|uniref:Putative nucleotidyltransferase n=1 Tax=Actinoplanes octamycinicus TaxID=135948 RepID=A0A7W7H3Y8_9ACTN|nr:nucleotidyltransferase domain-containing protein [Actinoplanes octamycinicus]MBB4743531.1 putative nucleotidyltransferase [Actinoplanes octamycinicus]GIE62483.1 nucleotidyltransferase [Actinoplanes octamycinicus]
MTTEVPEWAADAARQLPYPLIFCTVSGAHLYGFASVDSDLDLRGAHVLPAAEVVGLRTGPDTLQRGGVRDGVELDVVSHDLLKFAKLLTSRNGYVLEQLLSPLVVLTSPLHAELVALAPGLITRNHAYHYLGFSHSQEKLYAKNGELKPALYTLRVLLTGIHLMRTGRLETDLRILGAGIDYVPDLITAKREAEHGPFPPGAADRLTADIPRLRAELEAARDSSPLPGKPSWEAVDALHDLVVRTRLATQEKSA